MKFGSPERKEKDPDLRAMELIGELQLFFREYADHEQDGTISADYERLAEEAGELFDHVKNPDIKTKLDSYPGVRKAAEAQRERKTEYPRAA